MTARWLAPLSFIALSTFASSEPAGFQLMKEMPKIQSPLVDEASGLAISRQSDDFLWVINDSGGTPDVHLIGIDGTAHGKFRLKDTKNVDWEDLGSFILDGKSYLLVADTGDNQSKRQTCTLYVVREPRLPKKGQLLNAVLPVAWKIEFRYEDGPRDCESVTVDPKGGKIILLSKRTKPPFVYELPLRVAGKSGVLTARKLGSTNVKVPGGSIIPYTDQPTGLDIASDGSVAAAVTYYGVFLFPRGPKETWATAFSKRPVALSPHRLGQAESVAFTADGSAIYVVAEGAKAPLARYQLQPAK